MPPEDRPDDDTHGECRAEIERLKAENAEYEVALVASRGDNSKALDLMYREGMEAAAAVCGGDGTSWGGVYAGRIRAAAKDKSEADHRNAEFNRSRGK